MYYKNRLIISSFIITESCILSKNTIHSEQLDIIQDIRQSNKNLYTLERYIKFYHTGFNPYILMFGLFELDTLKYNNIIAYIDKYCICNVPILAFITMLSNMLKIALITKSNDAVIKFAIKSISKFKFSPFKNIICAIVSTVKKYAEVNSFSVFLNLIKTDSESFINLDKGDSITVSKCIAGALFISLRSPFKILTNIDDVKLFYN